MPIPTNFKLNGKSLVRHTLVETGTHLGSTIRWALDAGFKKIRSVDFHFPKHRLEDLSDLFANHRVQILTGPSPDLLGEMCRPDEKTLIYLDAHYCGNGAPREPVYGECPLLAELEAVLGVAWEHQPVIVIDDAQLFMRPWSQDLYARFDEKQWPTLEQITDRLQGWDLQIHDGVIYCIPAGPGQ